MATTQLSKNTCQVSRILGPVWMRKNLTVGKKLNENENLCLVDKEIYEKNMQTNAIFFIQLSHGKKTFALLFQASKQGVRHTENTSINLQYERKDMNTKIDTHHIVKTASSSGFIVTRLHSQ